MSQTQCVWVSHPLFPETIDRLKLDFDVITQASHENHAADYLKQRLATCDGALLSLSDRVDETALVDNTRLKVIANMAAGFNNLDLAALARRGIIACTTPGLHNETVADYA
jgi:gluconate 2-dehydrogenase